MADLIEAWKTGLPSTGYNIVTTLVVKTNLYVASDGHIFRLDYSTGAIVAKNDLAGYGSHELRITSSADGSSLFAGTDGYVISFNPTTLNILWYATLSGCGYNITSVLYAGGNLYAGSDGYVYRLDPTNGKVLSRQGLSGTGSHEVRLATTFANDVLLAGTNGYCVGLNASSLSTLWTRSLIDCGYDITSVAGGNACAYAGCYGFVYQIDSKTGAVMNKNSLGTGKEEVRLVLKGDGVTLFVGTNGYGISLSAKDLTKGYQTSLPGSGFSITDVAAGTNTTFYANNGYIFQLDTQGKVVSTNSLPGLGKYETRLAAGLDADSRVFAGMSGYAISLCAVSPPPQGAWMSALASTIGHKKLREIKIPGTHDSGTYSISPWSALGKDLPDWLKYIEDLGLPGGIMNTVISLWAIAQMCDFKTQLNAGIRYLDLRTQNDSGTLSFVHGLVGASVSELLTQVSDFLSTSGNEKEIILLDFNHFYNMGSADHKKLAGMLRQQFGNKLAPAMLGQDVTLNQLWNTSYRIIVFYADSSTVNMNSFLWSQSKITSPWPNVQDNGSLYNKLKKELPNKTDRFFVLQGILTTDGAMIAEGLIPFTSYPSSLIDVALTTTPTVVGWLSQWENQGINIVIVDLFSCTKGYIDLLLSMNGKSTASAATAEYRPNLEKPRLRADPDKIKQEIASGKIDIAQIAALVAAEYRARFGWAGQSKEVTARLDELDRFAATAATRPKEWIKKPDVVEDPSRFVAQEEPTGKRPAI